MAREKSNYDNYSSYYENVLRSQHHVLYSKEREIKHLKSELNKRRALTEVDMQCALADRSHELLSEVTELRATVEQLQTSYELGKKDGKEQFFLNLNIPLKIWKKRKKHDQSNTKLVEQKKRKKSIELNVYSVYNLSNLYMHTCISS